MDVAADVEDQVVVVGVDEVMKCSYMKRVVPAAVESVVVKVEGVADLDVELRWWARQRVGWWLWVGS